MIVSPVRISDPAAIVYAFGQRWGPEAGQPDKIFGFRPGDGIHDIHMNQGNSAAFRNDDGVWQDGGMILELDPHPAGRWCDRGDGIYQRRATAPTDGTGRRGHSCGRLHPGKRGSFTTNPANETPLERWPEAPRYCPSCGCRIARDNRNKICSTCDTKAQVAHDTRQAWLHERGLL
jgi:hypothetical protein